MLNDAGSGAADPIACSEFSALCEVHKERMQHFLNWLAEQGAVFPSIRMEVRGKSRSIHANTTIRKGALIMHVPRSLMITEELAKASEIGRLIAANMDRIGLTGQFAAFLLEAKRVGGFWKPYVDVLPQDFSSHPLFFSDAELDELRGTYALRLIRDELRWAANEYKLLRAFLPGERQFTYEEYLWAKCAVMSRVHHLEIDRKKVRALTPLADMPDHDADANVRWDVESSRGFMYIAKREIGKGEALTIDYKTTNNSSSFRIYGFCPQGESNNKAEIELPSMRSDHPLYDYAKNLGIIRGDKRAFIVSANHDNADARAMLSYLRLSFLDSLPAAGRNSAPAEDATGIGFIDQSNESLALSMLEKACSEQLKGFATSIEEDEALLGTDSLPINLSNAVRVRLGEKRVLRHFQELARSYLQANPKW